MATWNGADSKRASRSSELISDVSLQIRFGVQFNETLHNDKLPSQLVELLAYIAHEGVTTTDIFRRSGSATDVNAIVNDLAAGKIVNFMDYNFYTLASLTKKFLLKISGGLFGIEVERQLLDAVTLSSRQQKYETINSIITKLPPANQQLTSLLLGTWFRIVNHSEYNTMSSEAVAKSVAHCLFHTVVGDPVRLQHSILLIQTLIDDFGVVEMLGHKNIQYFSDVTRTRVSVREKRLSQTRVSTSCLTTDNECCNQKTWNRRSVLVASPQLLLQSVQPTTIEIRLATPSPSPTSPKKCSPPVSCDSKGIQWDQPLLNQMASFSAPEVNKTSTSPSRDFLSSSNSVFISNSLNRFDNVKRRQILRMKRRSHWFLSPNTSGVGRAQLESCFRTKTGHGLTKPPDDASGSDLSRRSLIDLTTSSDGLPRRPDNDDDDDFFLTFNNSGCEHPNNNVGIERSHASYTAFAQVHENISNIIARSLNMNA